MEAEHYTNAVSAGKIGWQRIPDFGRTLSGMTMTPVTSPSQTPGGTAARLEYRVFLFDSGAVKVRAYFSPTFNFSGAKAGLRYAISFDDQPPQIIDAQADTADARLGEGSRREHHRPRFIARRGASRCARAQVLGGRSGPRAPENRHRGARLAPSYLGPPESYFRRQPWL